jgi:hypothetical protein
MPSNKPAEVLAQTVLAAMAQAAEAINQQDFDRMADGLAIAISMYEQHPSQAHAPMSHLRDLLAWIRAARGLCTSLGRPDSDFASLEHRAEALRRPLH